jgi:hypothetical protein
VIIPYNQYMDRCFGFFELNDMFDQRERRITGLKKSSLIPPSFDNMKISASSPFAKYINGYYSIRLHSMDFDEEKPVPARDLRFKTLLLLAKINNGPVIGIINESNTFATYSGTRNAFRMFHFPTNEEEDTPYSDCRLSEAVERYETEDASNLNGLLPMRLVNSQSNPIFEIQRDGIGPARIRSRKSVSRSLPVSSKSWKYLKCKENIMLLVI